MSFHRTSTELLLESLATYFILRGWEAPKIFSIHIKENTEETDVSHEVIDIDEENGRALFNENISETELLKEKARYEYLNSAPWKPEHTEFFPKKLAEILKTSFVCLKLQKMPNPLIQNIIQKMLVDYSIYDLDLSPQTLLSDFQIFKEKLKNKYSSFGEIKKRRNEARNLPPNFPSSLFLQSNCHLSADKSLSDILSISSILARFTYEQLPPTKRKERWKKNSFFEDLQFNPKFNSDLISQRVTSSNNPTPLNQSHLDPSPKQIQSISLDSIHPTQNQQISPSKERIKKRKEWMQDFKSNEKIIEKKNDPSLRANSTHSSPPSNRQVTLSNPQLHLSPENLSQTTDSSNFSRSIQSTASQQINSSIFEEKANETTNSEKSSQNQRSENLEKHNQQESKENKEMEKERIEKEQKEKERIEKEIKLRTEINKKGESVKETKKIDKKETEKKIVKASKGGKFESSESKMIDRELADYYNDYKEKEKIDKNWEPMNQINDRFSLFLVSRGASPICLFKQSKWRNWLESKKGQSVLSSFCLHASDETLTEAAVYRFFFF